MKATQDNWKDVQKYFLDTFVICPELDSRKLLHVDRVDPGGMRVLAYGTAEKGFVEFPYEIKSPLTTRREYWQYGNCATLISRIPARMWRKGISCENTVMQSLTGNGTVGDNNFGGSIISSYVENSGKYAELKEMEDRQSIALSRFWAWVPKIEGLFILNEPVGKLSLKKKQVLLLKEFHKLPLPPQLKGMSVSYV